MKSRIRIILQDSPQQRVEDQALCAMYPRRCMPPEWAPAVRAESCNCNFQAESNPARGRDVYRIASLVAIACVLQIAESLIPNPIPGVRLGLANMITLVTMADLGFASAMEVAVLRTIVSSLVLGSFLTPGFMLSFFSAVASTGVMWVFLRFSVTFPAWGFSLIGISIASAVAHNATQLFLAYFLMIRHKSIFYFAPWLVISGVLMGWFTGLVAAEVLKRLKKDGARDRVPVSPVYSQSSAPAGKSFMRRLAPEWKIAGAMFLICCVLFVKNWLSFLPVAAGLLILTLSARLSPGEYFSVLRKLRSISSLAAASFLFPALFSSLDGGVILFSAGPVGITAGGLTNGAFFASRIMLMAWTGFLLNLCASPEEIAEGIRRLGRPFKFFGLPVERFAAIISISWSQIPALSARARAVITDSFAGGWRLRSRGSVVGLLAGIVSAMYCGQSEAGLDIEGKAA